MSCGNGNCTVMEAIEYSDTGLVSYNRAVDRVVELQKGYDSDSFLETLKDCTWQFTYCPYCGEEIDWKPIEIRLTEMELERLKNEA